MHRLLLDTLWQSGGRVTEVLRLRPADLVKEEGALKLANLKQRRRGQKHKLVYVSPELLSQLRQFAASARLRPTDAFFRSRESGSAPMSYEQCWRLIRHYAVLANVQVIGAVANSARPTDAISVTAPPFTRCGTVSLSAKSSSSWAIHASTRRASIPDWPTPSVGRWLIEWNGRWKW